MALKSLFSTFLIAVLAAGCSRSAAPEAAPEEPEVLSVTRWTEKTELFAEYPPLAASSTSRFAIHLTRLDGFKALTEGHVEVRLEGGSGQSEVFRVDAPSRPGIFGVDVKPTHAGKRQLVIVLKATGLNDEHRVGDVDVHPNAEAARAAAPPGGEDAPGISFLKEQQWSLDFGTALVKEQAVRESIRVPARLEARPGGAADVVRTCRRSPDGRRRRSPWSRASLAGRNSPECCPHPRHQPTFRSFNGRARKHEHRARPGDSRSRAGRAAHDRGSGAWQTSGRGAIRRGAGDGSPDGGRGKSGAVQRRTHWEVPLTPKGRSSSAPP